MTNFSGNKTARNFVVFHNERSTRSDKFDDWVINPLQTYIAAHGGQAKYFMVKPKFDDTIKYVAQIVRDGDTVIAAGGDGTLGAVFNGLVKSGRAVDLIVLPLGQSNDMTGSFGKREKFLDLAKLIETPRVVANYGALDAEVNGKHWYFALHEWGVGHIANIGAMLDEKSRVAKAAGAKVANTPSLVLDYYLHSAVPQPDAKLPAYVNELGQKQKYSVIQFTLGRLGGGWFPRVHGKVAKSLHADDDLAVINVNIKGKPLVDVPTIIAWTVRGMPARRAQFAKFDFAQPIRQMNIMVDGENFTLKNIRSLSSRRVATRIRLHLPE